MDADQEVMEVVKIREEDTLEEMEQVLSTVWNDVVLVDTFVLFRDGAQCLVGTLLEGDHFWTEPAIHQ